MKVMELLAFIFEQPPYTTKVSNSLDPDQARYNVGPDLDPNILQMLSAESR